MSVISWRCTYWYSVNLYFAVVLVFLFLFSSSDFTAQFSQKPPHLRSRNFLCTTLVTKLRSNVTLTQIGSGDPPLKNYRTPDFFPLPQMEPRALCICRFTVHDVIYKNESDIPTLTLNVRYCRKTSSKISSLQNDVSSSFPLHGSDLDLTLMTSSGTYPSLIVCQ